ncbi:hypothetical protein HBI47_097520 [Parastagonospora nodorum]|nr:hypothetical protein HBI47_097520 [Parastagonospora nodorum]
MVWGLGSGIGNGKGKDPVDERNSNLSSRTNSKGKEPMTLANGKGARKRPVESASPPPRQPAAPVPIQLQPLEEIFFCCELGFSDLLRRTGFRFFRGESDQKGSGRIATFGTWSLSAGPASSVVNAGTTTTLPLTREQKNSAKDSSTRDVAEETIRPECLATICHARTVALNLGQKSIMKGWLIRLRKRSAGHHRTISRANQISRHLTRTRPHPRIYHQFKQTRPPSQRVSLHRHTWCHLKRPRQHLHRNYHGLDLHMVSATGTSSGRHSKLGGDEMSEMPPQFIELRDTLREVDVSARPQYSLYSNLVADLLYMIQF